MADNGAMLTHVNAPATWQRVDCVSDVHLHAQDAATAAAWHAYLDAAPFDALFILGDLFEVWVGDDVLDADPALDPEIAFVQAAVGVLAGLARRRPVFVMHGNRDFLLGAGFAARTGVRLLADPARLTLGRRRWLLSHGDAWCTADHDYQAFRSQVRGAAWQAAFLAQPLSERLAQARALRARSQQHQAAQRQAGVEPVDVDGPTAAAALRAADADALIHGHTHRPGHDTLPGGAMRVVLSDWDARATPPRLQVVSLHPDGHWAVHPMAAAPTP
ncbi:UDP-2,3-diacylglucosamine diphosphatase [Tepidimonas taiwanensis]|uniref:UDP-2,3-diacylglucosamine hydrolase n=1 Tax=Tepidimonas taiwanensis TaxID=307486 RepID=A0A554XBI7_9BURK|nr:UDP-2,3-diacylglucosamine diphosphatase [Tepidimonas taiwanensis]MCX7693984.1 UDP-2,3-diacylglucosamine diphosphatase [Tepidimonas taiwanensis]MDM7463916.1 UDP-2,3-diacylglucosamine diphosphatase [Tepidimonas taiwanensis]TSE33156.1 UDP-2,3-diacylglucosamine hydrolase [Tepidimonas taiwanensis]UBQ05941.1 UDP-2,3-diacylglucosamine diphosphatase [Tepidimonas taiwanensis]